MSTSGTDEEMMAGNSKDSVASDDPNSGENALGNGQLKKGPWTSTEDAILVGYVIKNGEGNWNAVQKHTGLARCGKSCRLRWANHLRPDLKKGAFSLEEENLIVELHAKMGNKWARMAAELPGRTDNEIKNYWNTRIKRRQRAGLPIYPTDVCLKAVKETQQKDDVNTFSSRYHDSPVTNLDIPAVNFKNLNLNTHVFPMQFLDMPRTSLLAQNFQNYYPRKCLLPQMEHPSKRLRVSESLYTGINAIPGGSQFQNESYVQNGQPLTHTCAPLSSVAILNGNPSSSEPNWAKKRELPSLQIPQVDSWTSPSSPLPSLKSADALIQSPPPTEHPLSRDISPHNSGLLDAVLHESKTMKTSRSTSHNESPHIPNMSVSLIDTSYQGIPDNSWEQYGDISTFIGHPSMYSASTPISVSSFDEQEPLETITGFCFEEDEAPNLWGQMVYEDNKFNKSC